MRSRRWRPRLRRCAPRRKKAHRVGGWPADDRLAVRAQGRLSEAQRPAHGRHCSMRPRAARSICSGPARRCSTWAPVLRDCASRSRRRFPICASSGSSRPPPRSSKRGRRSPPQDSAVASRLRQQLGEDLDDDGLHTVRVGRPDVRPRRRDRPVWRATLRALEFGGVLLTARGRAAKATTSSPRSLAGAMPHGVAACARPTASIATAAERRIRRRRRDAGPAGRYVQPIVARRPTP